MPPPRFPPANAARSDGLVLLGGRLNSEWILTAYRQGIFPWPVVDEDLELLAWFSPDPRAVIEFDRLHVSRRLQRRIRSGIYRVTSDQAFPAVIAGCAAPRKKETGTWITPGLARAYQQLHEQGYVHSVEVWHGEQLVGGVYGLGIGGYFSGESMFHRMTDASKVALVYLVRHLQARGYQLLDIQQSTSHARSLGASELPRPLFLRRLQHALALDITFGRVE